jgi:hypothetical protein
LLTIIICQQVHQAVATIIIIFVAMVNFITTVLAIQRGGI